VPIQVVPATAAEIAASEWKLQHDERRDVDERSRWIMTLPEQAHRVETRDDLVALIVVLVADLKANPDAWDNKDLPSFMEAIAGWVEDMDGYYRNTGQDFSKLSVWRVIADLLMAARIYE
jgi:hypothetical protein